MNLYSVNDFYFFIQEPKILGSVVQIRIDANRNVGSSEFIFNWPGCDGPKLFCFARLLFCFAYCVQNGYIKGTFGSRSLLLERFALWTFLDNNVIIRSQYSPLPILQLFESILLNVAIGNVDLLTKTNISVKEVQIISTVCLGDFCQSK